MVCILSIAYGPKWPYYSCDWIYWIILHCLGQDMQVLYLGRAPRTKEILPDFREKCRVTRHSRVFRGLTGSQRTPGFWGVTTILSEIVLAHTMISLICTLFDNALLVSCTLVVNPWTLLRTTSHAKRRFSHQIVAMANLGLQLETIRLKLC